jgi:hypothetical protein
MITWSLAADPHVLSARLAGPDCCTDQGLDGWITFLERGGDQAGVTVESQRELGQVVGANRDAVEMIKELIRKNGVGRQLRSENQTIVDVVEGGNAVEMQARYFLLVSQDLWLSVCKITVDISSTDLVEELITGRRWFRYMASAWRSSKVHCSNEA